MKPDIPIWSSDSEEEKAVRVRDRSMVSAYVDAEGGVVVSVAGVRVEGRQNRHKTPYSVLLEVIAASADGEEVSSIPEHIGGAIEVFVTAGQRAKFAQAIAQCKVDQARGLDRGSRKTLTATLEI